MRKGGPDNSVRARYNDRAEIWAASDAWHSYTGRRLEQAVLQYSKKLNCISPRVLNVGSAGNSYGLNFQSHYHLDIAENHLHADGYTVAGDAENIPFKTACFDFVLCVGSVLNYCDAVAACNELSRVLKRGGHLLLEFESSRSGEYLFREQFGRNSVHVITNFQGEAETLWLFDPKYVKAILTNAGFSIEADEGFHSVTSIAYRFFGNDHKALSFAGLDRSRFVTRALRSFACNRVLFAKKLT